MLYPITRYFPRWVIRKLFLLIGPIVVGKVKGLKTKDGEPIKGDIIVVPMVARDMMADKKKAALEVERSIRFAVKRGARMVGLGALTSPVVGGGVDVAGKFNTKITNGNALTAFMAYEGIRIICKRRGVDMKTAQFAIVGATGSTGSAISKMLLRDAGASHEILIGRTPEHLESIKKELNISFPSAEIKITTDITELKKADVVVVATSAEGAIIKSGDLKENAIIYDVTQPQNVPPSIVEERPDIVVVDGAISKLPEGVSYTVNMGPVSGESFSCLAETMVLAQEKYDEDFSVGRVAIQNIDTISRLAEKNGFTRAPLRSWGKIIS
jgi:predicted amino acid dehydrogenase